MTFFATLKQFISAFRTYDFNDIFLSLWPRSEFLSLQDDMSLGKDDTLNDANPISTKSEQGHVMIAEPRLYETSKSRKAINQTALHTSSMKRVNILL